MLNIKKNLENIRSHLKPDICLVAVTKTITLELIEEAIKCGITDIGENRIQEANTKIPILKEKYPQIRFHLVGHLQTNKIRQALKMFDIIQSVDSFHLAEAIAERAEEPIPILVEVKVSEEASKFGVPAAQSEQLIKKIANLKNLRVQGLMTMAPYCADPEKARPYFKQLKKLYAEIKILNIPNVEMKYLSMGMSADYKVAIEEGSNMVRIGSAIFKVRLQ